MLLINKTLLKFTKGLWPWILAIVCANFFTLIGSTAIAKTIAEFLGHMFEPMLVLSEVGHAIRWVFVIAVFTFVMQLIKGMLEYKTAALAREKMREQIFSKVMELDVGGIEKIGPVSAITSSVDAVEQMQTYISNYLPSLIFSVIAPIYLFFNLKDISLFVAILLLCISLILLPLHNGFRSRIEEIRKSYWTSLDDMTAYYMDSLKGLTTLKLFDRDQEHSKVLSQKANALNININRFMKINFTSFLVTELLIYLSILVSLVHASLEMMHGQMDISQALVVLMLGYSFFSSEKQLMNASHGALTAISAAGKVEEIFKVDTSRPYDSSIPINEKAGDGITMDQVSFQYEGRSGGLKDVSIHIPKKSVVAFVGLSGCGKSTTASLLMRFMDPVKGRIYLEGKDYFSLKPEEIRKHIAMVPQEVHIFSGTIKENLLMANPNASDIQLKEALEEAGLLKFVNSLEKGIDTPVGNAGASLSGGQKQKIGIARALLSHAEYMIFDEATSSVDPESEKEIWQTISNMAGNRTLILISHRMSSVKNADCIYVLKEGRILEAGCHEALMQEDGLYKELVLKQKAMEVDYA